MKSEKAAVVGGGEVVRVQGSRREEEDEQCIKGFFWDFFDFFLFQFFYFFLFFLF